MAISLTKFKRSLKVHYATIIVAAVTAIGAQTVENWLPHLVNAIVDNYLNKRLLRIHVQRQGKPVPNVFIDCKDLLRERTIASGVSDIDGVSEIGLGKEHKLIRIDARAIVRFDRERYEADVDMDTLRKAIVLDIDQDFTTDQPAHLSDVLNPRRRDIVSSLRTAGMLNIGIVEPAGNPLIKRDKAGKLGGFEFDLTQALVARIAKKLDCTKLVCNYRSFKSLQDALYTGLVDTAGRVDLVMNSISITRFREEMGILFTNPYLKSPMLLIGRRDSINKELSASSHVAAVDQTTSSLAAQFLKERYNFTFTVEALGKSGIQNLFSALDSNRIDFIIVDGPIAAPFLQSDSNVQVIEDLTSKLDKYYEEAIGKGFAKEEYAIAATDWGIVRIINEIMTERSFIDSASKLRVKYGLTRFAPDFIAPEGDLKRFSSEVHSIF